MMSSRIWGIRDRIRLHGRVRHLHRLGPRPLYEFLDELVGDDPYIAGDVEFLLHRYGDLDPGVVDALGGYDLERPVAIVAGGRR